MLHRIEWARRALGQAATEPPNLACLVRGAAEVIQALVPHHASVWHLIDPQTLVPTSRHAHGVDFDPGTSSLLEASDEDYALFADLARAQRHATVLSIATGGQPDRSRRYRELLAPGGIEGELRLVFVADGCAWGCVALYRRSPADFSRRDAEVANALSAAGAKAFRAFASRPMPVAGGPDGPGLLLLDERNRPETLAGSAAAWLADLGKGTPEALPFVVLAIADRTRPTGTPMTARVRGQSGRWAFLHGSSADGGPGGRVAVIVDEAGPSVIAPLLANAYGLTARERAVADLVLDGCATGEIAERLYISPHTVQQHLKSVFAKSGVRSRRELVGRMLQRDQFRDDPEPVPA